jgi:hypothetical protein
MKRIAMVTLEELREARYRQPFRPFLLRLKDGRQYFVNDFARIGYPPGMVAFFPDEGWLVEFPISEVLAIEYPVAVS